MDKSPSHYAVRVRAPSRLHFGLLAFGEAIPRQFGGVGVMVDRPYTEADVDISESAKRQPSTPAQRRAREFALRFINSLDQQDREDLLVRVGVYVRQSPPEHVGLGSGTQLALTVARAMAAWCGQPEMSPTEMARRVGRGTRSAIGVHGFGSGGFLVEAGKREPNSVAPLVTRLEFPAEWHWLLVIPSDCKGLHGAAEREAFEGLAPIEQGVTAELCRLVLLGMSPAVAERDFASFSEALFEFGQKVGQCFAACQGGIYASPLAQQVVEYLGREGLHGVAQSSWGPTLAVVTENRSRAEWLAARLPGLLDPSAAKIVVTPASNHGAKVEVVGLA